MRTTTRARTALGHPRSDCSSGLAHVRQSPRLAWSIVNGQHRGPVRRFRPRVAGPCSTVPRRRAYRPCGRSGRPGPIGGTRMLWHLHPCVALRRIVTSQPHRCTSRNRQPEPARKPAADEVPGHASGAPGRGAAAKTTSGLATKRAPSLSASQAATGPAWLDTPPAAGRAWVPGCRARTSERP